MNTSPFSTVQCRNKKLNLQTPKIMGILNVTPDSFSDGGQFTSVDTALSHIEKMVNEGASVIDIGGESTRPGADPVSVKDELERTIPVLKHAVNKFPDTLFSIDTTKYDVANKAIEVGAHIINDVSGLENEPRFVELCRKSGCAYICMHSQGDPKTMQNNPSYSDVVDDIYTFFEKKILELNAGGVENILLDPGIGFGKTLEHNARLIGDLDHFSSLKYPILIGASRKAMIGKILGNRDVDDRLIGTITIHYHCLMKGASIIRVHDVKEAADSIKIFNAVTAANN
ncbi:MAG: dihydropteroate synthase [Balneolaceae bacterium]